MESDHEGALQWQGSASQIAGSLAPGWQQLLDLAIKAVGAVLRRRGYPSVEAIQAGKKR
jgi:hypothetical protein